MKAKIFKLIPYDIVVPMLLLPHAAAMNNLVEWPCSTNVSAMLPPASRTRQLQTMDFVFSTLIRIV